MSSFINDDEYIILLDLPLGSLPLEDLRRLRGLGVKTGYYGLLWFQVEPQRGRYDWTLPDIAVERAQAAGMKLLLQVHGNAVTWAPDDWYVRDAQGHIWRNFYNGFLDRFGYNVLSPWNHEALSYERQFMQACCDRYNCETVQCVCGGVHGGEAVLPGMVECWYDGQAVADFRAFAEHLYGGDLARCNADNGEVWESWAAVQPSRLATYAELQAKPAMLYWLRRSLTRMVTDQQQVCVDGGPWRETWFFLPQRDTPVGELIETGPRSGNWLAGEFYEQIPEALNASLNILLFEVWRGAWPQAPEAGDDQGTLRHIAGFEKCAWIGSQYSDGLLRNTERTIQAGLRGFLTGPLHPDAWQRRMTPEMFGAFEWSLARWKEARA